MGYIGMCGPKGYDILAVLVRNMVLILPFFVPKQKGKVSILWLVFNSQGWGLEGGGSLLLRIYKFLK